MLRVGSLQWPVHALDARFRPCAVIPGEYKFCVAVNYPDRPAFALLCEEVGSVIVDDDSRMEPVQECMLTAANPIRSLLYRDGRMMLISDVDGMHAFLAPELAA